MMGMPDFRTKRALKLGYRGVALAALATLAQPAAHAQQAGVPSLEAVMNSLPAAGPSEFAMIDIVAMSFALLAAILSLRAMSANRTLTPASTEPLAMTAASPTPRPSRSSPQQLIERIRGADRPDAKSLLASGIKLLSASDEPKRLVGIAALEAVALGNDPDIAVTAMEHLADHMQDRFRHSHDGAECAATAEALSKAGLIGRSCERTLTFAAMEDKTADGETAAAGAPEPRWRLVGGVKLCRYLGGRIEGQIIHAGPGNRNAAWCSAVKLVDCTITDDAFGSSCVLTRCRIMKYNPERPFINGFIYCDFSGCVISQASFLADLRDHGCWYDPADPPQGDLPVKWTAFLHEGDPGEHSSWKTLLENNLATRH